MVGGWVGAGRAGGVGMLVSAVAENLPIKILFAPEDTECASFLIEEEVCAPSSFNVAGCR